jgi:hypothetical protein
MSAEERVARFHRHTRTGCQLIWRPFTGHLTAECDLA